jgi:hypothetical protein
MPNQFYDPYEYGLMNLRQEIDRKYDEQQDDERRRRELNGVVGIGSGSATSSINRFNAAKRQEYMAALDAAQKQRREDTGLALQQRSQAFNEASALGQMGISNKNLNRLEKERTDTQAERDRRFGFDVDTQNENLRRLEDERKDTKQYRAEEMALRRETFEDTKRQSALQHNVALRQMAINKDLANKKISLAEYRTRTEANLKVLQNQSGMLSLSDQVNQIQKMATEPPEQQLGSLLNFIGMQGNQAAALNSSGQAQQGVGTSLYNAASGVGANIGATISQGARQDASLRENARQFDRHQELLRAQMEQEAAAAPYAMLGQLGGSLVGAAGHALGRR